MCEADSRGGPEIILKILARIADQKSHSTVTSAP
jgi:hypothetical protein